MLFDPFEGALLSEWRWVGISGDDVLILFVLDLMDETYDVVVCGTGLIECILSGLLSQESTPSFTQTRRFFTLTATPTTEVKVHQ